MASSKDRRRTGRRPGASGTREAITDAARHQFAELGYDRATIRGVATEAGVDPALVVHFFGSKQRLFLSVMTLPFEPEEAMPRILAGRRSEVGLRLAQFAVGILEEPKAQRVVTGIIRAATSEPEAARMVRDLFAERVVGAIAEGLAVADARLRANLVSSQVIGLVMARYVVRVEPLASLPPEALIKAIAPTFQRYLVGPLEAQGAGAPKPGAA
ncbi:MAG TPA: TetR family transcriptional regulator [Thermoleophilaceae bacterium]|nr:TetR family transcriptional regulator [Thermoleophilaceae bacterium]